MARTATEGERDRPDLSADVLKMGEILAGIVGKLCARKEEGGVVMRTLCVECGPDISVDDEGCCVSCGNGAVGEWLENNDRDAGAKEAAYFAFAKGAACMGNRDVGDIEGYGMRGRAVFEEWWARYGRKTYEGDLPKESL